jgi:hypothetical protein
MQEILELNPELLKAQFEETLKPIRELGHLNPPNFSFDLIELPLVGNFSSVFEIGKNLETMYQQFPASPEVFISELLGGLTQLGQGSSDTNQLLGPFRNLTTNLSPLLSDLETSPKFFQDSLIPAIQKVSQQVTAMDKWLDQNQDSDFVQLFQLNELATNLSSPVMMQLQDQLNSIEQFSSINRVLASGEWYVTYNNMLQTVSQLDLANPRAVKNVRVLLEAGGLLRGQIVNGLNSLTNQTKRAEILLNRFNGGLVNFEKNLTPALCNATAAIDPNRFGIMFTDELLQLMPIITKLQLGSIKGKIEKAVQIVEGLLAQNLDKINATLNTIVATMIDALALAEQAIVKVSALLSNLVQECANLIKNLNLEAIVEQVREVQADIKGKIAQVLDKINATVAEFYAFIKEKVVAPIREIDFQPIIQLLKDTLYKITTVLEHPQVQNAIEQARKGIDLIVENLDAISLKPVFDEVLSQSEEVKGILQNLNVSQLNPVLRQALSLSLGKVRSEIDPPEMKIAQPIFDEYQQEISPHLRQPIEYLVEQFGKIEETIKAFEPGKLVADLLTPPFEAMLSKLEELLNPEKLIVAMKPVQDFYTNTLAKVDQILNPTTLLTPVVEFYDKLLAAAKALTPQTLLAPVNKLISKATSQLDNLHLENIIANVIGSVKSITDLVTGFRLEDSEVWQEVEKVLSLDFLAKLEKRFDTLLKRTQHSIDSLNLTALQTALKPLIATVTTVHKAIQQPEILSRIAEINAATQSFTVNMTALTKTWQVQFRRLNNFRPEVPNDDYLALIKLLQGFNPINMMAVQTQSIDALSKQTQNLSVILHTIWSNLAKLLKSDDPYLNALLAGDAQTIKNYLKQAMETLAGKPMHTALDSLIRPLAQIRDDFNAIKTTVLKLQGYTQTLNSVPESLQTIGDKIIEIKNKITEFDLDFLSEAIQNVLDEVVRPLEALHPSKVVADIQDVYSQVREILDNFNPVAIIGSARDTVKLARGGQSNQIEVPFGTHLIATTPIGDITYRTLLGVTLEEGQNEVEVLVQALKAGRGSDLVTNEGITWKVDGEGWLATLQPSASGPILSLATLALEVILEKIRLFHPAEIVVEPLNAAYQKIVELLESLGINRIFDTLVKKFDDLEQELKEGLDRSAKELSSLLAAMPF